MEGTDRRARFHRVWHIDKSEAARLAGDRVDHDTCIENLAVLLKQPRQQFVVVRPRQVAYEDLCGDVFLHDLGSVNRACDTRQLRFPIKDMNFGSGGDDPLGWLLMRELVGAIDQGTTSTRFIIFDRNGDIVAVDQKEHEQIFPQPGWVEHNAEEIWANTRDVVAGALAKAGLEPSDLAAVGITNQRETTVVWDRTTGEPVYNAIVWQDTRTDEYCTEFAGEIGIDRFRPKTGLPLATYFAGPKIRWIIDNVDGVRDRAASGDLLFGTTDSWLVWNLTGGIDGGLHITDVTNASRTLLMNLETLDWDPEILRVMSIPVEMLPDVRASSEIYATALGVLEGVPLGGILGDQQAALFGQVCFAPGQAKNTYGTGCFLLLNTGTKPVPSPSGLLTTLAYKLGDQEAVYALEGSVAIAGALVQWVRDNLGLISSAAEIEEVARLVEDNGGVYFVPAFSGLFAPHWRSDARGVIAGLTRYVTKGHLARAVLEATAWQTREVLDAMRKDSGVELMSLQVDGGMVENQLLMQFQADVLATRVVRPKIAETTALGAAYAAGLATGVWDSMEQLTANWQQAAEWNPDMDDEVRESEYRNWKKAVERTLNWVD